ncbi:MAG: cystathionine gamma-synthase [Lentimonas sp.]|jgi:cystathionine gamma-synthase
MNSFRHFPLGEPLCESPHAIASSLPTLADVCGYEENDPLILSAMKVGYPRFVLHPYVHQLTDFFLERKALTGRFGVLVARSNAAQDLLKYVGSNAIAVELEEELQLVHCDSTDDELIQKIRKYLQHVGCGVSSRQAEALLVSLGCLPRAHAEILFEGDAVGEVTGRLAGLYGCDLQDVWMCASGMNAFYTGFCAVQTVQQRRGRTRWVQLGWLYLDSGCVLKTFLDDGETLEYCYDVMDTDAVIDKLSALGNKLAGVVVECPTNPLVQICDLERISDAVHAEGGLLIIDPTVASVYNMDVLAYADVLVTSLTKYAAYEGDIMIGSLALNIQSSHYDALKSILPKLQVSPYEGCLKRLAHEMQDAAEKVAQMNANAAQLTKFLKAHPAVSAVYYAADSPHHAKFARSDRNGGAMISIELAGSMQQFYDKIAVMKGPSFGTRTTLLSPFMYLAHYDLVTQEQGRSFLKEVGLTHDLIRISVGIEPYEEIEAVFAEALEE